MNDKSLLGRVGERDCLGLLGYAAQFDERAHSGNDHVFDHIDAAGEGGLAIFIRRVFCVIPNLTVSAVAVPAKIAVGNCLKRKVLKAS